MDTQPNDGILEEFRIKFLESWNKLPNKAFFFALLAAWAALFQFLGNSTLGYIPTRSLFHWMYSAYNPTTDIGGAAGDDGHGNLIPFVVLGIFWYKRKELVAVHTRTWPPALALVAFGLLVHVLGFAVQQPRLSIVGLFAGIYGLMGLAWGPQFLLKSFFPFCLFVFSVPLGPLALGITFPLRMLVTKLVALVASNILAIDVIREGTALRDPTGHYQYEVAAACSGIRSLIATSVVALVYGMLCFKSWWKRLAVFASAVPLAVLGNMLRMLAIIIAAEIGGQEAGNKVHDGGPFGIWSLLPYVPVFFGLLMLGRWLGERPLARGGAGKPGGGEGGNGGLPQAASS